ncbi:MAG TPA: nuclear transport factor 2 family protein [Acidimicrobiales bacterium]
MLSADDRLDIIDLLAATAQAIDSRDGDALITMFTPDGQYTTGQERADTAADIASMASRQSRTGTIRRHTQTTTIEETGEGCAHAVSYVLVTEVQPTGSGVELVNVASGVYDDDVILTEQGWRIAARFGAADGEWSEMI